MARLTSLPPRVGGIPSALNSGFDRQGHSVAAEPWTKWYHWARWKHPTHGLRIKTIERDGFTCQWPGCGKIAPAPELVADHRKPHRGDPKLFWDPANLWTLCTFHHNSAKQAEERKQGGGARLGGSAPSGKMAHPTWFRRVHIPLTVVCGPPGAGKSTYVARRAGPADRVICFDELARALFGEPGGERTRARLNADQIADVLRVRNERLADLMRASAAQHCDGAWLIVSDPSAADRQWWHDQVGASVVVLATPADECLRRIDADAAAGDVRGAAAARYVADWWRTYAPAPCDQTVS